MHILKIISLQSMTEISFIYTTILNLLLVFFGNVNHVIVLGGGFVDFFFFFSSRIRHTILSGDWSSDVCSSDLVETSAGARVLHTRDATIQTVAPGVRSQFLGVIANPSVAFILLLIVLCGLGMEGMHPGGVLPGVVGAICLLLALYAFQLLPVNFAGLGLILLGVILIVSEAFVPAYGVLGTGGVISFVIGSVILMRTGV